MYDGYLRQPELLPPHFQTRVSLVGLERTAGEYLAGMTDRFCEGLYQCAVKSGCFQAGESPAPARGRFSR
jgi:hypothetical protein